MYTQVTVGHLKAGDCIGEVMLKGTDRQPYTVASTTKLTVGWVTSTILRGEERDKYMKDQKVYLLLSNES